MSVPKPPSSLDNSCAVIHDKTLYTFSSEGFLSLPLKQGAKWKKLAKGEKVTGAKCVGTDTGLFVVGGQSDAEDYAGLQKYSYDTGKWESVKPTDMSMKNRQWHGATYLKAVDRLVIYAGTRNGAQGPSSETFTIQASEPWEARSFDPGDLPQLTSPILLPWSDADAMMIAGDPLNTRVSLFNQDTKWRPSGATLADPLPRDTSTMNAILVNGDDGSKSLLIFDLGASPNQVKRVVLQDASGAPVANSAPILTGPASKRELTLDDWPEYNATLAPKASRTNFAMAHGDDGVVVFAGGDPDEPIAMFDTKENSWMNATNVLVEEEQKILAKTKTSSSSSSSTRRTSTTASSSTQSTSVFSTSSVASTSVETTATSTSSSTSLADTSDSDDSGLDSTVILGITLGSIVGFLALLGLLLLCLRRRKLRQNHSETGHARRASGMPAVSDEKDSKGFANGAMPPTSPGHFRGHHPQGSQDSFSSMAILMGRMGQKQGNGPRPSHDTARTSNSSLHKHFKSTISKPIPHAEPVVEEREARVLNNAAQPPAPRARNGGPMPTDGTRRSSGWNRYWSGGSALQLLGFGGAKRNTGVSEQSSRYSESPAAHANPRATQDSATVPPLNFEGRASMNRVNSGSPVVSQHTSRLPLREGLSGKIERPASRASSGYSSGIPESVNEAWDPTSINKPWGSDRAPSSAYSGSDYYGTSSGPGSHAGTRQQGAPSGISKQPQLAMASTSDMSWLNLGDQRRA